MGLDDRDALAVLRAALNRPTADQLIANFYTCWFAIDPTVRDLFPASMHEQRTVFTQVLDWVLGEFIDQHADAPVAFLSQLGRDHRKYGVTAEHFASMTEALYATLRAGLADGWTPQVDDAARQALNFMAAVMKGAAEAVSGPAYWDGTVIDHQRVSRDLAIVRMQLDQPLDYFPGQYVDVQIPQCPRRWRCLSPAIPAQDDGRIEFHVRAVSGGIFGSAVVGETVRGDRWRLSSPHGAMEVDRDGGGDVLMVAGSTGLAPLRAIIMDLARFGTNPRVHLFYGARYACELYDLRTLWQIAAQNPWLSVTPVAEFPEPVWAADYPDVEPPRGLHVLQRGRLPEVVTRYGNWSDRQILISGGPAMLSATRTALIAKGAPAERIQHDPLTS